ncbi:MAG TPA: tRNA(Ile)(2)-agmatinylcytidine synthase [Thermoplasmata archaeon]|nr:tRNA(Ile)(2)-agmatinylcytidine synthase [Thermoplasmata archaeon]
MTWVGIDDTDSRQGGCTTYTLTELIRDAISAGYDLVGHPRLVRLNPNIPFKTRGNAALAARFGHGVGRRFRVGQFPTGPVYAFHRGKPLSVPERKRLGELGWKAVMRTSAMPAPGTDPALVVAPHRLPARLYWEAVRGLVESESVGRLLDRWGVEWRSAGSGQGVVGATAAVAWAGGHPTFELLAYRAPAAIGTDRRIDPESVRRACRDYPSLFLCFDQRTRRLLVAPHTSCPILMGIRSTEPACLPRALGQVVSEPIDRWMVFQTNQATGDHLVRRPLGGVGPFLSASVTGVLRDGPLTGPGGHVRFSLAAGSEVLPCIVFEPTKTLPRVVRSLLPGDRLRVAGGCGSDRLFRVERVDLLALRPRWSAAVPPRCPKCHLRMHSAGAGRGFRCRQCRVRLPPESAMRHPLVASIRTGRYDPTPSARRHLHPLAPE